MTEALIRIERVFNAPRDLVFRVWTQAEHLTRWWGSPGVPVNVVSFDLQPGGLFHYSSSIPAGTIWGRFLWREIVQGQKISFLHSFTDHDARPVRNPFNASWPLETWNEATFYEEGEKTRLVLVGGPYNASAEEVQTFRTRQEDLVRGFAGTFDQLQAYLADEAPADRELLARRLYDAPVELVYRLWTDPAQVAGWWGPDGFTCTIEKMDVKKGGEWLFVMHGPDGRDYPNRAVYTEVIEDQSLAYTHGTPGLPDHFSVSVEFRAVGDKTELTMRLRFMTNEQKELAVREFGAAEGLGQTLNRLRGRVGEQLSRVLVLTRTFDAPRQVVFEAWTDPVQLARWWSPQIFTCRVHKLDVRPMGKLHLEMIWPDGTPLPMHGHFHEVVPYERLVLTTLAAEGPDGKFGLEIRNTVTLKDVGGQTELTLRAVVVHADPEMKQALEGMTQGWNESLDKLKGVVGPRKVQA